MVQEDRHCIDGITQLKAVRAALEGAPLQPPAYHTKHCVAESSREGGGVEKIVS